MFAVGDKGSRKLCISVRLDGVSLVHYFEKEGSVSLLFDELSRILDREQSLGEVRSILFALSRQDDESLSLDFHEKLSHFVCQWCAFQEEQGRRSVFFEVIFGNESLFSCGQDSSLKCRFLIFFDAKKYFLAHSSKVQVPDSFRKKHPSSFVKDCTSPFKKLKSSQLSHWFDEPIDMVIQTEGIRNMSRFYLYNVAYSEFFFLEVLSLNFNLFCWDQCRSHFLDRNRRYGS